MRPKAPIAASTAPGICSLRVTSRAAVRTVSGNSAARGSRVSGRRAVASTRSPAAAAVRAIASPRPEFAPVMSQVSGARSGELVEPAAAGAALDSTEPVVGSGVVIVPPRRRGGSSEYVRGPGRNEVAWSVERPPGCAGGRVRAAGGAGGRQGVRVCPGPVEAGTLRRPAVSARSPSTCHVCSIRGANLEHQ